jgi:hypothetical protein
LGTSDEIQRNDALPISRIRKRDSSSAFQIEIPLNSLVLEQTSGNPAARSRPRLEIPTVYQLRQTLQNETTNSMVFMPFLRSVFREGENPTNHDEAILNMLHIFWEEGEGRMDLRQSVDSIRNSYKALQVYNVIRVRYNMGPDTYIPAHEQECLLGQFDLPSGGLSNTAQTHPFFRQLSQTNNPHTRNILRISQCLFALAEGLRERGYTPFGGSSIPFSP